MEKLSLGKQLAIVRLYLNGDSYDEIAAQAGVSKGSVANVIADLKAGRLLAVDEPAEQIELLRELAVDLRRHRLVPGQVVVGMTVLSRLQALGIEPADIEGWATICRELAAGSQTEAQALVRAALALEEVRKRTGLGAQALEEKVQRLEGEVARLEPLRDQLGKCQRELRQLEKRREQVAREVTQLEKRLEPLNRSVSEKERREAELSRRVQELERRAQAADERLAAARRDLQALAELGLSLDDLPGFVQRLSGVAQRHGIEPGDLLQRLLHELEGLDAGLDLESYLKTKRKELSDVEQAIMKAQRERQALDAALQELRQQQAALHASIAQEQAHIHKEMRAVVKIATDATAKLKQDLGNGAAEALREVERLRDQALELGQELGRFEDMIEANEWLQSLVALVRGDGDINASQVRVIGLSVLRGMQSWLERNKNEVQLPYWLTTRVDSVIQEFEQWRV